MRELGNELRQQREQLGLDLDQVQAKTKIRKRYLAALEEGDWSILPGEVYARGFVRSYAEAIGLDGRELLERYAAHSETKDAKPMNSVARSHDAEASKPRGLSKDDADLHDADRRDAAPAASRADHERTHLATSKAPYKEPSRTPFRSGAGQVTVVVCILAALGGGLYWLNHQGAQPGHGVNSNTALNVAGAAQPGTSNASTNHSSAALSANSSNSTAAPLPAVQIQAMPYQTANQTQVYTVKAAAPLAITMNSTADCWFSVTEDTKIVDPNDTIHAGQVKTFKAAKAVSLRLGHVQGVSLSVNGQPVTLPPTNQPINVVFNHS